jgi:hypothetical protein
MIGMIYPLPSRCEARGEVLLFGHYVWLDNHGPSSSILEILWRTSPASKSEISGLQIILTHPIEKKSLIPQNNTFIQRDHFLNYDTKGGPTEVFPDGSIRHDQFEPVKIAQDNEIQLEFRQVKGQRPQDSFGIITFRFPVPIKPGQMAACRLGFDLLPGLIKEVEPGLYALGVTYLNRAALTEHAHRSYVGEVEMKCWTRMTQDSLQGGFDVILILPAHCHKTDLDPNFAESYNFDVGPNSKKLPEMREAYYLHARNFFPHDPMIDSGFGITARLEFQKRGHGQYHQTTVGKTNQSDPKAERADFAHKNFVIERLWRGKRSHVIGTYKDALSLIRRIRPDVVIDECNHFIKFHYGRRVETLAIIAVRKMQRGMLWLVLEHVGQYVEHQAIGNLFQFKVNETAANRIYQYRIELGELMGDKLRDKIMKQGTDKAYEICNTGWSFVWIRVESDRRRSELLRNIGNRNI